MNVVIDISACLHQNKITHTFLSGQWISNSGQIILRLLLLQKEQSEESHT